MLAIGPRESELCQIIEEADCGLTVPVENIEKLVDAMLPLSLMRLVWNVGDRMAVIYLRESTHAHAALA